MTTTPLSLQLQITAKVLALVMTGRSLGEVLQDGSVVKPDLRAGVQALSFAALRQWGMATELRSLLAPRLPTPLVDALLCTALALLVSDQETGASYTEFTLVNQAVEAAKAHSKTRSSSSFLNASLRRFLREREALTLLALQSDVARYNHPQWWVDKLRAQRPSDWQAVLAANQTKGSLTLRINETKIERDAWMAQAAASGLACEAMPAQAKLDAACGSAAGVVMTSAVAVTELPGYREGWFSVQDAAAQAAAAQLLDTAYLAQLVMRMQQGEKIRILDACAAPGGKTTHLLERLIKALQSADLWTGDASDWGRYFEVVAIEMDTKRTQRIHDNLTRLKLRATVKVADASNVSAWWDGSPFDAILLDAPCTASGIVRRHPDIRWVRRATDPAQMAQLQLNLLTRLWPTLRLGGRLLFATCSIFQEEGDAVIQAFQADLEAARTGRANELDSHGLWLPCARHDGFYDALLEKTAA